MIKRISTRLKYWNGNSCGKLPFKFQLLKQKAENEELIDLKQIDSPQ